MNNLLNVERYKYKVSVIVPCYNTKPWLDECLQSLVDQTLEAIEIICVNDGSTDGTGEKLDQWKEKYPNKIKVIHQKNSGPSAARNAGMKIAQGECIGFVDSDDFVDVCMYDKLYKVLVGNSADLVKCGMQQFTNKSKLSKRKLNNIKNLETINNILYISINACDGLYRTKFLQKYNLKFIIDIYYGEDVAFNYELAMYYPRFYLLKDKLYYYRKQRKGQLTSYNGKNPCEMFKAFEYLQNKITDNKFDNLVLIRKLIIRREVTLFALGTWNIQYKYKKKFLFKASFLIFNHNKALTIYKTMLLTKYRNPINYFVAPMALILFHSCYLWQKLSFKKIFY